MNFRIHKRASRERGYVLLTLMLFVALLTVGLLAVVQNIEFQIRRDREEELIHRGAQYSRAVRRFFTKFKRYPGSIEELESTNNVRFLRKRYKDPITGKDFKLLYLNEVAAFNRVAGVAETPPAALPKGSDPGGRTAGVESGGSAEDPITGTESAKSERQSDPSPVDASQTDPNGADAPAAGSDPKEVTVLHGVPIVGVASLSHEKTIREFNNKNHYNQWQFIFNPGSDSGGLINAPDQPGLRRTVQASESQNGTALRVFSDTNQAQHNSPDSSASVPNQR